MLAEQAAFLSARKLHIRHCLTSFLDHRLERIGLFTACNAIRTRTLHAFYQSEFIWTFLAFAHMFWYLHFGHSIHLSEECHFTFFFQFLSIEAHPLTDEATSDIASYTEAVPHAEAV